MGYPEMNERDVFIAAMQIENLAKRQAYLAEVCGADTALRRQVESLLVVCANAGSFLESPPPGLSAPNDVILREGPGTIIGPYKLLEQIGEGGMGVVFMAEQAHPVQRKVALKIIKPGMDSALVIARFEAERQALALMEHPNIARVLDAGTTGFAVLPSPSSGGTLGPEDHPKEELRTGRPYFVMELVKGVPITTYCDQHHLTPRERLELFVPVCQAVQHAHTKGIIHRDLKPSNVLVARYDGRPVPKVIDFGVAKATGPKLTERTMFTEFGAVVGTLEYMSPEQAELNQLDIDTRSDIYALGVLLYELLTGTTPLERKRMEDAGLWEMLRLIREGETQWPSTRLSTAEDLPAIAANRGVEPRKLSALVRGELDWIVMKALEKDRNRRYGSANDLALDIQRYLADEPVLACPPSAGYRLRKFARRHQAGLAFAGLLLLFLVLLGAGLGWAVGDRTARKQVQQKEADTALSRAAGCLEQGKYLEAAAWAERAEGSLAGGEDHPALRQRLQAIRADLDMVTELHEIRIRQSRVKNEYFDNLAAEPEFARAFRSYGIDVEVLGVEAAPAIRARPIALELLLALDDWADVRRRRLAGADGWQDLLAVALAADADELRNQLRRAIGQQPFDLAALRRLAASDGLAKFPAPTLLLLGNSLRNSGAVQEAVAVLRLAQQRYPNDFWVNHQLGFSLVNLRPPRWQESLPFYMAALGLQPDSPGVRVNLGSALCESGDAEGSIAVLQEAIRLKLDYATAYCCRGNAYVQMGQHDKAMADYAEALALQPESAAAWYGRGNVYRKLGQHGKAVADYTRALKLNPDHAKAWCNRGNAYWDLNQREKAFADYHTALKLQPDLAEARHSRGLAYQESRQPDKAIADYNEALRLNPNYVEAWNNRGTTYASLGQQKKAIADFTKAINLKPDHARAWSNRGLAHRNLDQREKAFADYARAIKLQPTLAEARYNRGLTHQDLRQLDKAIANYDEALRLNPDFVEAWNNRGLAYRQQGQLEKAVADYSKALKVKPNHVRAWNNRGFAYLKLGQHDRAIADFAKVVELTPASPAALNRLAWLLVTCPDAKLRDPRRAVEAAKKAVALAPRQADYWTTLGVSYYRAENWKASIEALEKAITLQKNSNGAVPEWFFLAMAHWQMGHEAGSRQWYKRAAEWMDKHAPEDEELKRFRAEAAALLENDDSSPLSQDFSR
jgi:tetratricopeptide (TPR) repeat protein/serine/threonine protein kinase